jgi:hypothetical protein
MAQGQLKKPSSQLAKGHKKAQNKQLSKGSMSHRPPTMSLQLVVPLAAF